MNGTDLGKIIKEHRKAASLTQKQLADKLGKAESTVRMWELGKNTPPLDTLKEIGETLEIPLGDLLIEAGYINEWKQIVGENIKKGPSIPTFGEAIKEARNDWYDENDNPIDVPLSEIAQKSNIPIEILEQIENGKDIPLSDFQLLDLAKALDITFAYLYLLSGKETDLFDGEVLNRTLIRLRPIRYSDMKKMTSLNFKEYYELEDKSVISFETARQIYDEFQFAKKIDSLLRLYSLLNLSTDISNIKEVIMSPIFNLNLNGRNLSINDRKMILSKIEEMTDEFEYED